MPRKTRSATQITDQLIGKHAPVVQPSAENPAQHGPVADASDHRADARPQHGGEHGVAEQ